MNRTATSSATYSVSVAPGLSLVVTSLSLSLVFSSPAGAQADHADQALDPVVVTANRVAVTSDETLASISVITRQDIERQQASSIPDALRGLPGVSFVNNGGPGKQTSLFLRGSNSDHVLFLLDGVKIGSATSGGAALQNIPIDQVDRIEIVRGPRASLYGSEAIGGVVQIFTRKGREGDPKTQASFSLGGGSRDSVNGSANLSFSGEKGWLNVGATGQTTGGINACQSNLRAGCYADEPDRDGYRDASVSLRGGYKFSPDLSLDAQLLHVAYRNHFDGSAQNEARGHQQMLGTTLRYQPLAAWTSSLAVGRSIDDAKNYLNDSFSSLFKTTRTTASWQNDIAAGHDHMFSAGFDWLQDKIDSSTRYDRTSRDNRAIFGQYMGTYGATDVQLSLREDDNEQFGYYGTGSVAAGYTFTFAPRVRLTASYGTAFKAPTFNQLYYPNYGNPDLKPEKAESYEIGLSGPHAFDGQWKISVYQSDVRDLISSDSSWVLRNISKARIRGVEGVLSWKLAGINFSAFATLLDPVDQSGTASDGNDLPRRARQIGRLDADYNIGPWLFGTTIAAQGKTYDNIANTIRLGGFGTVDLRAEYRFSKELRLQARLENLFDKDYQTAYLYNQPGFGAFLTLRYEPR